MSGRRSLIGAKSATVGLLTALLTLMLPGTSASAEAVLDTAEAQVQIQEDGSAQVELTYRIAGGEEGEGADSVSFSALNFGEAVVEDLQVASADGTTLEQQSQTAQDKTTTLVTLPEPLEPGQSQELVITYAVPAAGTPEGEDLSSNVPIVAMDNPAPTSAPGTFTATVALPQGHSHVEGFPSNTSSVTQSEGATVLHYSLPAVPALLRAVTTAGEATWWTTEALMELLLGLAIVAGVIALYFSFVRPHRTGRRETTGAHQSTEPPREPAHADNKSRGL